MGRARVSNNAKTRGSMKIYRTLLSLLIVSLSGCGVLTKMMAKGGTEYKVQITVIDGDKATIVDRAIAITKSKLDAVGLDGEVRKDENDPSVLIVRVYGTEDPERTKAFLFTSYQLELRKVISPPSPSPVKTYPTAAAAQQVATSEQEVLQYGAERRGSSVEQFVIVENSVIVNGEDIRDASAVSRSESRSAFAITFSLKPEAAVKFGDWTGKNINNYLAVILDKRVQSIAFIKSQIFDSGEINGNFSKAEAEDIALSLKSGYLPATMKVLEEKQFEK